jgi:hypothetical protein
LSIFIAVVAAYVGLSVLNFVRRRVMAFIYSMITLAFWAFVVALGFYVWNRGLEQSFADLGALIELFSELEEKGQRRGQGKARQKSWEAQRRQDWR